MTPLTGKERSRRVPLDYYRLPGRWWKLWLCIAFFAVPFLVWAGFVVIDGRWGARLSSPGPIHVVHATWANDCSVCHAGIIHPTGRRNLLNVWSSIGQASDQLCQKCHAGAEHHKSIAAHAQLRCADCHRDHQGTDVSMVRMADSVCTRCHANLAGSRVGGDTELEYKNDVTSFTIKIHPDFKVMSEPADADGRPARKLIAEARDPGRLKFNHALHLRHGQKHTPDETRAWVLKDVKAIDEMLYQRYKTEQIRKDQDGTLVDNQKDDSPVELNCASCHRLDMTDLKQKDASSRGASGAYMLPVTYENDCRGCHPLSFDAKMPAVQIPHHLQPEAVRDFLWGAYAVRHIRDEDVQAEIKKKLPLPGKVFREMEDSKRKEILDDVYGAEKFLYRDKVKTAELFLYSGQTTCGLCHEYKRKEGAFVPASVLPPLVPEVWMPHARFSHRAHRAVRCQECHASADASDKNTDVLLPAMADCLKCHSPTNHAGSARLGGARFDCVECHRYHGGDVPMHNVGSKSGAPKERSDGADFRSGR